MLFAIEIDRVEKAPGVGRFVKITRYLAEGCVVQRLYGFVSLTNENSGSHVQPPITESDSKRV